MMFVLVYHSPLSEIDIIRAIKFLWKTDHRENIVCHYKVQHHDTYAVQHLSYFLTVVTSQLLRFISTTGRRRITFTPSMILRLILHNRSIIDT